MLRAREFCIFGNSNKFNFVSYPTQVVEIMADTGILMNFALEDSLAGIKPVFRGGRWKDRLKARKITQRRRLTAVEQNPLTVDANVDDVASGGEDDILQPHLKKRKLAQSHGGQKIFTSQEVVSSLFSSNPSFTLSIADTSTKDETLQKPSNAPLFDGLDTFTSLGLCTPLATLLLTKLHLKAPTAIQKATITQLVKENSDAFIQAETGSGKTLAYLLPIVQRIMDLSKRGASKTMHQTPATNSSGIKENDQQIHRTSGLFAIILAPTRELCKQISVVLNSILGCAHWIVAGTVIGGEKKKSEKARLRKGLNILVATPGRLADHLLSTDALDVSSVRWLVLDEGDRLMELGFEEEIKGIVAKLEAAQKSRTAIKITPNLPDFRTTILCSATMKMNVHRLGEISLKDAVHLKVDPSDPDMKDSEKKKQDAFFAPVQLKQSYIIVPAKQRTVTLTALLKRTFARKGSVMKAIVFLSCADSVDFHFEVFRQTHVHDDETDTKIKPSGIIEGSDISSTDLVLQMPTIPTAAPTPILTSPTNPLLSLHKLHGSLSQPLRTATLSSFTRSSQPSVLLCTDVASRGLDLPNIDLVIEYDPPFSADDHLHRVGRTARAGKDGRAIIFLMPGGEEGYVDILKNGSAAGGGRIVAMGSEEVLRRGLGSTIKNPPSQTTHHSTRNRTWQETATALQLSIERWVIDHPHAAELARKAYISHVRAYATHVVAERHMFDVKSLHLGHLAKAFGLRERPGHFGRSENSRRVGTRGSSKGMSSVKMGSEGGDGGKADSQIVMRRRVEGGDVSIAVADSQDAARRMRKAAEKKIHGIGEFNVA